MVEDMGLGITKIHYVAALVGYLLGSVPFGLLLSKLFSLGDLRDLGSGNIGATNVLRTGHKLAAFLTLLLDGSKGAVAVIGIRIYFSGEHAEDFAMLAGLGAVFGHNFPLWLRFVGGKGVATTLGVLLAFAWPVGLGVCLIWLLVALAFRYSSLAAIAALLSAPILAFFYAETTAVVLAALLAILGLLRHAANIKRLFAGTEPKIGAK